jgi:hypothetical protein
MKLFCECEQERVKQILTVTHYYGKQPQILSSNQAYCNQISSFLQACDHSIKSQWMHPLKEKFFIWQNILYQVLDMSTQYNILYHTTQDIVFDKKFIFSFETVYIVITKKIILSNKLRLF